jgi:hypothetical protein
MRQLLAVAITLILIAILWLAGYRPYLYKKVKENK